MRGGVGLRFHELYFGGSGSARGVFACARVSGWDGIFIFDPNTVYKYRDLLGETTIAENREEGSFIWENYFDEESAVNEYDLTLYIREDGETYRRFEEVHYQRAYDLKTIGRLLADAGMELTAAYDAFTKEPVRDDSERIYVVARPRR